MNDSIKSSSVGIQKPPDLPTNLSLITIPFDEDQHWSEKERQSISFSVATLFFSTLVAIFIWHRRILVNRIFPKEMLKLIAGEDKLDIQCSHIKTNVTVHGVPICAAWLSKRHDKQTINRY